MEVIAIDVHIHLCDELTLQSKGARVQQMARYFGRERKPVSMDELADQYRQRKMMAVIMNTRDETVTGLTPVPNDHVAEYVRKYPDVFLAYGAIDPWTGKLALDEIRRCKEELGLHGIGELNPARQHFYPNDVRFYPLWEEARKLGLPILFHG
ncbi:MAG: amidohydrolase family protein, partial [Deltaproteobacteria bacterium]|nr:amidohydrolase family protein [Deltaproteobacteria bacterium]